MGIPYSRELDATFRHVNTASEQVTPLVAQGFKILKTARSIVLVLACIQVFTFALLLFILIALLALLVTMNPDLAEERRKYVTPTVRILTQKMGLITWAGGATTRLFTPAQESVESPTDQEAGGKARRRSVRQQQ
jgi:hypothetical protein